MNTILLADLISTILDGNTVDVDGNTYVLEAYSEDEKLVVFVNAEDEDESQEYVAIMSDTML